MTLPSKSVEMALIRKIDFKFNHCKFSLKKEISKKKISNDEKRKEFPMKRFFQTSD